MVIVESEAIFIGANKQNQVSDFHRGKNIVAFGAGKTVALWNPLEEHANGVYATLKGHKAEITCVKFIPDTEYMVSTSEDHHVKIWKFVDDCNLECIQTIEHYQHTIVSLTVLSNLFAIGCADGTISLWVSNTETQQFVLAHDFSVQKGFYSLAMSLSNIQGNEYLLAIGGTNVNIFVFTFTFTGIEVQNCKLAATLEGHEDWVKSLAFRYQETPGDYLLASGSQDRYIRLWRIRTNDLIDNSDENDSMLALLNNKQYKFEINSELKVAINFEALIMGHDDWISSLQWHEKRLQLLASTADTSIMLWEPDESSGIWICGSRLGEISTKGASTATGSSGGFWSCLWFSQGDKSYILTNGKTGSWRVWYTVDNLIWEPKLAITGAAKEVTDVAWSPNGQYLLSTSLDQTTRLYAPWVYDQDGKKRDVATWHEFSRPQIHGYDMVCVEPISDTRFVSGGDEKILRSFDLPKGVSEILHKFVGINFESASDMPESAALPALGLSNKATSGDDGYEEEEEDPNVREDNDNNNISYDLVSTLNTPPLEDQLQRHLLWPEIEKLYGHGYEIACVDVSPDRKLIASACRSKDPQNAVIRIFDTASWLEIKPTLAFHNLTITKLRFSKDSKFLLSVCRDRQWAIWERNFEDNTFTLKYKNEKPHTRIIWDCDWTPLEFGNAFVTAARDKTVKLWRGNDSAEGYELENLIKLDQPVTAIAVYDSLVENKLIIAVGLESGAMHIYNYDSNGFKLLIELDPRITPADKITRLRWSHLQNEHKLYLGVASNDNSTRIYSIEY